MYQKLINQYIIDSYIINRHRLICNLCYLSHVHIDSADFRILSVCFSKCFLYSLQTSQLFVFSILHPLYIKTQEVSANFHINFKSLHLSIFTLSIQFLHLYFKFFGSFQHFIFAVRLICLKYCVHRVMIKRSLSHFSVREQCPTRCPNYFPVSYSESYLNIVMIILNI